jgi:hypothetical protein
MIDVEVQNVRRQNVEQITENVEFIWHLLIAPAMARYPRRGLVPRRG